MQDTGCGMRSKYNIIFGAIINRCEMISASIDVSNSKLNVSSRYAVSSFYADNHICTVCNKTRRLFRCEKSDGCISISIYIYIYII